MQFSLQYVISIPVGQTRGPKNISTSNISSPGSIAGGGGLSLPHPLQADSQRQATGLRLPVKVQKLWKLCRLPEKGKNHKASP